LKLALGLAEEMETLGRARDNLSASLLGKEEHGIVCFQCGEFTTARTLFEQCDALKDSTHRAVLAAWVVQDQHVQTLAFLAMTLACQGYVEQGRERLNKALPEARELRHALTLANALHWATFFETAFGSPNQAIQYAEEATSFSSEHGFPLYAAWGDIARGRSLTVLGHAQEGLDLITKGLSMHRATGAKIGDPAWLTIQAEAYGALGRPLEGLNCLDEATQIIDATEGRDSEAEMLRLRGDLLNATGDEAAAEESYHQAPAVARKQQAKSFELRAAMSMARLWRDQGKRNDARELLAPVYGWFTEGFDTRDLKEAKALLEELAA
jgi:tetratricopeptide (TPR) repeat protein